MPSTVGAELLGKQLFQDQQSGLVYLIRAMISGCCKEWGELRPAPPPLPNPPLGAWLTPCPGGYFYPPEVRRISKGNYTPPCHP